MMEERAGEGYETLMRREVFKPLGMRSADFRTLESAAKLKEPAVWGHQADGKAIDPRIVGAENPSVYASCGTVNLSILDYARYAQWHLGKKPEPLLKNQTTFDHLHTGLVKAPDVGGKYGSGWILVDTPMGPAMSHAGSNTNCFAVIWVYPKKDFAAIACTNTGEQAGYLACEEAIQKLVELYVK
jgi:CubicO group peptidase (beta-lactamase class C family)